MALRNFVRSWKNLLLECGTSSPELSSSGAMTAGVGVNQIDDVRQRASTPMSWAFDRSLLFHLLRGAGPQLMNGRSCEASYARLFKI
jgi:hypothetical protein